MVFNFEAYVRGLLLPLAFFVGLLARWYPSLRFSWPSYSRDPSGASSHTSPWKTGLFVGILTWIMFGLYGVLALISSAQHSA